MSSDLDRVASRKLRVGTFRPAFYRGLSELGLYHCKVLKYKGVNLTEPSESLS